MLTNNYMKKRNIILSTDYYKQTHYKQYPPNTQYVYSYAESRGGEFNYTVPFGLQGFLAEYWTGVVVESWMIDEAEKIVNKGLGFKYFNRAGWERIVNIHGGRLPIRIKAAPEGMVIDTKNVLLTIENLDPELPWLTNFLETALLRALWYPTTVCTLSRNIKKLIEHYCKLTGCEVSPFHLNDFGARGASSAETAAIGGAAHLVNFMGTDTIEGVKYAMDYYGADVCGFSVIAAEHSTITAYGKENERLAYETILRNAPDEAIVSIVSDSYDIDNAVQNIFGKELKELILSRKGKLVVRPDSGDPAEMSVRILRYLWDAFGGTYNEAGYKILNPKVGVIYGDGINYQAISSILFSAKLAGFAACNIIFGMGGALLQHPNRDTQKFALKLSEIVINNNRFSRQKQPKSDPSKASKAGRLKLVWDEGAHGKALITVPESDPRPDVMRTVFENGFLKTFYTFEEVRQNSNMKTIAEAYANN